MQSYAHSRNHSTVRRQATVLRAPWLSALKLLLTFSLIFFNAAMQANPVGPVVTQGAATFDTAGNRLTVTNTPGTVIHWNTFNIPAGNTTHFQQQGADSSVLNRVVTNDPSKIFGTLSSNGRVILVNQAGIVVGAGAVVDTAGFIASTLNMSEADRLLNKGTFAGSGGSIQIDGMLRSSNGDIVLIAPQINVGTQALVKADNGVVTLAAGQQVMLTGRGLEGITLELQAPTDKVVNLGRLEGDAVGLFASQLKHSGAIQARTAYLEGGRVVLKAIDTVTVNGQVDASGTGQASSGGRVTVEGNTVALQGASIASTGTKQGGQVLVGGGWQGKDTALVNSQATTVDANSTINVAGQGTGSAGTAVVWSDGSTRYAGQIDARGGNLGGNGGQVEVSGKEQLGFSGTAQIAAPAGTPGSLLLDPKNIVINSTGSLITPSGVTFADSGSTTFFVDAGSLQSLLFSLAGGTLTLQATNDITNNTSLAVAANGTLKLEAGRDVVINQSMNFSGSTASLVVIANSPAGTATLPWRDPGTGNFKQTATATINVGTNGNVYISVGNGAGGGGTITVGNITAEKIVLDNIGTGGGIARSGSTALLANQAVVLRALGGPVGDAGNRMVMVTPKVSVRAVGDAYLETSGTTRLGPAQELGGAAASVTGKLDMLGSFSDTILVGGAGTETGAVSVSAGTLTMQAGAVRFGSSNTNTAALNVNVGSGQVYLTAVAADVTLGGTASVAPVNVLADSLIINGNTIRVEGAPFVTGGGNAYTSVSVNNGATLTSTSSASNSILIQGGGGVGNDVNLEAGSLTITANNGGVQLVGGSASNTGVTVRANTGSLALNGVYADVSIMGGSAGASGITVTAVAGTATVSSGANILVLGGPGAVGGSATVYGDSAVVMTTYSGDIDVIGDGAAAVVASNLSTGDGVRLDTSLGRIKVEGGSQLNAFAKVAGKRATLINNSSSNDIYVTGGPGNGASAQVEGGSGGVEIISNRDILISGGTSATATGAFSAITSAGNSTLTAASGSVLLSGGAGTGSSASIDVSAGTLDVTAASIGVNAGAGPAAFARVVGAGNTRVAGDSIGVTAGTGAGSPAEIRSASGNLLVQALTPSQINVTGGNAGASSYASLTAPTGTVTVRAPQGLVLAAGNAVSSDAFVQGNGVVLDLSAGQLRLEGSFNPAVSSSAYISSVGNTSITAGTTILNAQAGLGSKAEIYAGGNVQLSPTSLSLAGGSSGLGRAAVTGVNGVNINSFGPVFLTGGAGSTATVSINSGPAGLTITAPTTTLLAGAGTSSAAGLRSTGPVSIFGDVSITGGFGAGAQAGITTSGVISTITGAVSFVAGSGTNADAIISASNGTALAAARSLGTVTTATLAGSATSQIGVVVPLAAGGSDPAVFGFTPPSAVPGSGGQFTVTVANLGGTTDTLSLLVSGLPNGTQSVAVGVLAPGATTTVVVSYAVGATATGTFNPSVSVSGLLLDEIPSNNIQTSIVSLTPQVNFGVSVGVTTLALGVTNGVAVTVNNTGPSAGTGTVFITDPAGGSVSFVVGLLPGGSSSTLIQFFVGTEGVAYTVAASVATVQPDVFTSNNSASQALLVPPTPPLPATPSVTPTATVTVPTPTVTVPAPTPTLPTPTVPTPTPTLPTPTPTLPTPTPTVPVPTPTVPTPTPTLPTPTVTVPTPTPTQPPVLVVPPTPPVVPPVAPLPTTTSSDPSPARQNESFPGQFARLVGLTIERGSANDDIVITDTQCRPQ